MSVLIFTTVMLTLAVIINRYYTVQNKKKFAEAEARLAKALDE